MGENANLPLAGVTVVEFCHSVAGPYAGSVLADLGADVIKVESPDKGDYARDWGPPFAHGTSTLFHVLNHNKRGLALDLRDRVTCERLIAFILDHADVVLQNMRPGAIDKLGLGAEALRAKKPSLIYCDLGAYGRTKLAGEQAIAGHNPDHAIARTAWLFGVGGKNFCDTMLNAAASRDEVAVVTDQVGSPTWTGHLSPALLDLAAADATGIFHTAGGGQCSWHELTVELYRAAGLSTRVNETTAADFQRPAPRPAWSVLATERDETPRLPRWQDGVAQYLNERENGS